MKVLMLGPGDSIHIRPWVDELSDAGHSVEMLAYGPVTALDSTKAVVTEVRGGGPIGRASWILREISRRNPDVLIMHYASTDALVLSLARLPLAISVWGSDVLVDLSEDPLKRLIVANALRRADLVVSPAAHVTAILHQLGVSEVRILTGQYGVTVEDYTPLNEVRGVPLTAICTRRWEPIYGMEDILRAVPEVHPGLVSRFVLAGGGSMADDLHALAEDLGIADRVEFLGPRPHEDLMRLLAESDIYLSMSRSDGSSLSLLEAMATGLVPIVSEIPANREWIRDGENGRLVGCGAPSELASAISAVASDYEFRRRAGAKAREDVEAFGNRRINMGRVRTAIEGLRR